MNELVLLIVDASVNPHAVVAGLPALTIMRHLRTARTMPLFHDEIRAWLRRLKQNAREHGTQCVVWHTVYSTPGRIFVHDSDHVLHAQPLDAPGSYDVTCSKGREHGPEDCPLLGGV